MMFIRRKLSLEPNHRDVMDAKHFQDGRVNNK